LGGVGEAGIEALRGFFFLKKKEAKKTFRLCARASPRAKSDKFFGSFF
jgi:hypothetical protein